MKRQRLVILILASLASVAVVALLGLNAVRSGRAEEGAPILTYPDITPTATIAPLPPSKPNTAASTLLSESFDSPDALAHWEILNPPDIMPEDQANWEVQDGVLRQTGTGAAHDPNINETMAVTGDASWTNYTISAKVYDQENATFGLVARRQGNSFYRYRIIASSLSGTPKQVLEKVVDGVATPLATREAPGYEQRQWHTVALSVAGAAIRVSLDGAVVAEATDATLTSGQAGLYTRALGGIRFDDVTITAP
ncbi:MAG TPA: family 16 glycoside hydrolase [Roseiflexaceae bacterium]|nr:family 16 glycoside hydrolase [Roseiflexaceae bacterium]